MPSCCIRVTKWDPAGRQVQYRLAARSAHDSLNLTHWSNTEGHIWTKGWVVQRASMRSSDVACGSRWVGESGCVGESVIGIDD